MSAPHSSAHAPSLLERLPQIRGKYREDVDLGKTTWFQVGGAAEVLFKPEDAADLAHFMRECPDDIPVTVLGVGSNLLIRDGGIDGVVIKLGRGFTDITVENERVEVGAGAMDVHVAEQAMQHGIAGLEFLSGIPGGIGGALAMNGGAYGSDVSQVLVEAEAVTPQGELHSFSRDELRYSYRHCGLLDASAKERRPLIFTKAVFLGSKQESNSIAERMMQIAGARETAQPIRSRTGGSTFKNPQGYKAWQLIDEAECRGLKIGGAQVSEKHCNFLINTGNATAADLENLGEEVRARVQRHSGIVLEWEIKRVGRHARSS